MFYTLYILSPVDNVNSPVHSIGSNSQSCTFVSVEFFAFLGERRMEESSDAAERSSSSSDCKISSADKVDACFEGVCNFVLLENTLPLVLTERQLASLGEIFDLLLVTDGILVEMPRPMVDGAWSLDLESVDDRGICLLTLVVFLWVGVLLVGVLRTLVRGLTTLLLGVKRARSFFSF